MLSLYWLSPRFSGFSRDWGCTLWLRMMATVSSHLPGFKGWAALLWAWLLAKERQSPDSTLLVVGYGYPLTLCFSNQLSPVVHSDYDRFVKLKIFIYRTHNIIPRFLWILHDILQLAIGRLSSLVKRRRFPSRLAPRRAYSAD
jgi:hypothetical protein